jgi:hypothetical protein
MSVTTSNQNQVSVQEDLKIVNVINRNYLISITDHQQIKTVVTAPTLKIFPVTKIVNVVKSDYQVIVSRAGPPGPQGPSAGELSHLDDLVDVLTVSPADGDLLKYSGSLNTWTNSNRIDGGNF